MEKHDENLWKAFTGKTESLNLKNEVKYKLMLEAVNDIMWEWNIENNKLNMFGNYKFIIDFDAKGINSINEFINKIVCLEYRDKVRSDLQSYLKGKSIYFQSEFKIHTKNNEEKWIFMRGKALKSPSGKPIWMAGSIADTTQRKLVEERIEYLAYHDLLTRLPNNIYLSSKLKKVMESEQGAIIFIGIDNFKNINDTLGHDYGDLLLILCSELIQSLIVDKGMVARFCGDIFSIILYNTKEKEVLKNICDEIINIFKNPFELKDIQVYCTVSIGIAIFPDDGKTVNEILKNADTAMHNSKAMGKNNYSFYDEKIAKKIIRRSNIENGLREAIENNELQLYYQPQIDIKNNKIKGLEVLLRWISPKLGFVSPDEFIPIAEETGLIVKIGAWVLKNACDQCKKWIHKGYEFQTISVNISPVQINKSHFLDLINNVITKNGLKPKVLELEITEGTLIKSIKEDAELLNRIIDTGVRISIDDFGKGYSSLNYLTALPISTLKIDKSFIDSINKDSKYRAIVSCIIRLAKDLKYSVIAEGVEKSDQKELLEAMGCNYIQGYYYSKPLPEKEFEKLFITNNFS
ncbi:diguanylate cyclase (GGDEF) domain-containing protein [Clostridium pasteurianum DSM 525 = ATCC 6013]|uniref:Diguanylate cyclase (GGDEF) domain-containing protein n=1 Tax=Clostridium pasteurianum DSM 525 = ATCC 6013 TaxID=1262449 RepID=A0A0H3JAL8_CLOPA|nr:GGDEF domain-containing phosphodiesterase [Clostridium pasteurianum]AJA49658.1 diguanylate cyclase (GGDEF) domain-containing protein [Clostridium pasteurianum DSM 525 = ATCC 6013]AJA53646.1 diguanylate cyclase (GGDEF) domain-containing protein [Clostridium pasteurianum DSM 525 = ATCC 6013]AOZ76809.1 hypothetical protein AQ983_17500 [Clostridium pasteurianum DSM 525 = ATCC 6013]AOZ80606.1 hypothetical protein AQ984_17495 [Clostridium pasteurianum]ELP58827.1 hypothetical protein F502_11901 [C